MSRFVWDRFGVSATFRVLPVKVHFSMCTVVPDNAGPLASPAPGCRSAAVMYCKIHVLPHVIATQSCEKGLRINVGIRVY